MEVIIIILILVVMALFMGVSLLNRSNGSSSTTTPKPSKSINIGTTGIITKCLYHTVNGLKQEFYVTYEVEVIAISETKIKLKVLDYSSGYSLAYDQSNKGWITKVVDNGWSYKQEFEPTVGIGTQEVRDRKLNEIGIK